MEKILLVVMNLLLKHDRVLRLNDKQSNPCMTFKEANLLTSILKVAKEEWDAARVPAKPHLSGRAFRHVARDTLWLLAKKLVEEAWTNAGGNTDLDEVN